MTMKSVCSLLLVACAATVHASRALYVPFDFGGQLVIAKVDPAGSVLATTALPGSLPAERDIPLAVPPDQTAVYVAGAEAGGLWKLDGESLQPIGQRHVGCHVAHLAVLPDHSALFVLCRSGAVHRFDPHLEPTGSSPGGDGGFTTISVSPAAGQHRGRIYLTAPERIHVLYADTMTFKRTIALPSCRLDFPAQWHATTAYVLCARTDTGEGVVHRIDACGGDVMQDAGCWPKLLAHVGIPSAMAFTPSRRHLFVTGEHGRIERFRVNDCATVATATTGQPFPHHAIGLDGVYPAAPDAVIRLAVPGTAALEFFLASDSGSASEIVPLTELDIGARPAASGLLTTPGLPGDICPYCQP